MLDQAEREDDVRIILEVDVYRNWNSDEQDEYMAAFVHLRDFKNDIFFESITEKTAELFSQ